MKALTVILWTGIYSIATAASIVLVGQRDIVGGNLLSVTRIIGLLGNWKFILSLVLALIARFSFIMTNNSVLRIPSLAGSATTVTTFITLLSLVLTVVANIFFLGEHFRSRQIIGMFLMIVGIAFISSV